MYAELRRLAASVKRNDPNSLVSTGTLVHEAWSKLARSSGESPQSEPHFKSIAACAMRQILKDAARRQRSAKRGGGNLFITLDESIGVPVSSNEDLLRLDAALDTLAEMSPRQAKLVELRYYGGLNNSEIEALLGIGERTVERDWRAARAWLSSASRNSRLILSESSGCWRIANQEDGAEPRISGAPYKSQTVGCARTSSAAISQVQSPTAPVSKTI
jgi:RNA polymerase sigma factor (TIGR02999 family)